MKKIIIVFIITISASCQKPVVDKSVEIDPEIPEYALVIHGGAGTILKENMTDLLESEYISVLDDALESGKKILQEGGTSIEAVRATIRVMEDSPLFNAGKGAVFTNAGSNEMDASIMEGKNLNAGSVGGVTNIKNPIDAAIAVMNKSDHVLLTGKGAEQFAASQGIETVDPSYFYTKRRWDALERVRSRDVGGINKEDDYKYGTVGAVALDKSGDIAAGTSTGGMTNKKWNRLGDSPIIGAGTYANNETGGISCTGHGEYFIRYAVAHDISALMEYREFNAFEAGDYVIKGKLVAAGGSGGAIILDRYGNIAMPFNTAGMYRGYIKSTGEKEIKIYND